MGWEEAADRSGSVREVGLCWGCVTETRCACMCDCETVCAYVCVMNHKAPCSTPWSDQGTVSPCVPVEPSSAQVCVGDQKWALCPPPAAF